MEKEASVLHLSIHGDTFNTFKYDFDAVMRGLVGMMISKESEEAKLNVSFKITLAKDVAPDPSVTEYSASRDVVIPKFEHKIKSAITIKEERDGFVGGEKYELVFDPEEGYVLKPIDDLENRLFDPDNMDDDEPDESAQPEEEEA